MKKMRSIRSYRLAAKQLNQRVTVSLDAEWTSAKNAPETIDAQGRRIRLHEEDNWILSWQLSVLNHETGEISSLIVYPEGPLRRHRKKLSTLIGLALDKALSDGVISSCPRNINIAMFFSRADLSTVSDFNVWKRKFALIRKTYTTSDQRPSAEIPTPQGMQPVGIRLMDLSLMSPAGSSLDDIGAGLGIPKVHLPDGYSKDRMDIFLRENREAFEHYAITDAVITARYCAKIYDLFDELGVSSTSPTLGSVAVKLTEKVLKSSGIKPLEFLGKEEIINLTGKRQRKERVPDKRLVGHWQYWAQCYHGGLNGAYALGFSPPGVAVYDIDVCSAYTTAMALIRVPDWASVEDVDCGDANNALHRLATTEAMTFAHVIFKFPPEIRFPGLPSRAQEGQGLIYPYAGESFCTGAELLVALSLGAKIVPLSGRRIEWLEDRRPFEEFTRQINALRKQYKKQDPLLAKMFKEIGNSAYGKISQAVAGLRTVGDVVTRKTFNTKTERREDLGPSPISQPAFAAYTTGIVRALLIEAVNSIPSTKWLGSITTDGFATTASLEEVNTTGPIATLFREARARITPENDAVFEYKHQEPGVYIIKTRGVISTADENWIPTIQLEKPGERLLAKVSYKSNEHTGNTVDHCEYWIGQLRDRDYNTKTLVKSFIPPVEQHIKEKDLFKREREVQLNMCYDFKRDLINVRDVACLITADTVAHQSLEAYHARRSAFDAWRKSQRRVLKNTEDYIDFMHWEAQQRSRSQLGIRTHNSLPAVLVAIGRAAANAEYGFKTAEQKEIALGLSKLCGRQVSVMKVKNIKRRGHKNASLIGSLDVFSNDEERIVGRVYHAKPSLLIFITTLVRPRSRADAQLFQIITLEHANDDYEEAQWDDIYTDEDAPNSVDGVHLAQIGLFVDASLRKRHLSIETDSCGRAGAAMQAESAVCGIYGNRHKRHLTPLANADAAQNSANTLGNLQGHSRAEPLSLDQGRPPHSDPRYNNVTFSKQMAALTPGLEVQLRRQGLTSKHLRLGRIAAETDGTPEVDRPMAALAHALAVKDGLPVEIAVLMLRALLLQTETSTPQNRMKVSGGQP